MDFQFVKPPFEHQEKTFAESKDLNTFAVLWEQGTGKTKLTLDTIQHKYLKGEIDAVLVVAPNGVELNWITDEIPDHVPEWMRKKSHYFHYQSKKAGTKTHQEALKIFMSRQGMLWLVMSYDAFMTETGKKTVWKFLKTRKVFYVLDESTRIKTPSAKRTISIVASGRYAKNKRILTGTPVPNGPFDIYSQMRFLNENFWKPHGLDSFTVFKTFFGVWERKFNNKTEKEYDDLLGYQNLDKLYDILQSASSRITKEDAGLNLPPKLYTKRYFELTKEQWDVYNAIKDEYMAILSSGDLITAPLAITRLLRLHQVTSGYIPTENDEEPIHLIGKKNPRLDLLKEIVTDMPHSCIIWARFQRDIDQIMDLLGDKAVRYDGLVDPEQRAANKLAFQHGEKQFFVGNPAVGAEGLTLVIAKSMVYYNNDFNLHKRLQSEDRCHRIGQDQPVQYYDLIGNGTVDNHIVNTLRSKLDVANQILGDKMKEWL